MAMRVNARTRVAIAGINTKCGKYCGCNAMSANKVALKETDSETRMGLNPLL